MKEYTATTSARRTRISPPAAHSSGSSIMDLARAAAPLLTSWDEPPRAGERFPSWHPSAHVRELAATASRGEVAIQDPSATHPHLIELVHIELVAASFATFRDVGCFQQALAAVPEVSSIRLRHLQAGILQVHVQCKGTARLLAALANSYARPFSVLSHEPHRVEILIEAAGSRAEADDYPSSAGRGGYPDTGPSASTSVG